MLRGILIVILIVALVVGGWMLYKQSTTGTAFGSGDVFSRTSPTDSKDRTDGAYTDLDGPKANEQQTTTYDQSAPPPADRNGAVGSDTRITAPALVPEDQQHAAIRSGGTSDGSLPVTDSIPPDPPNHMVFAGSGPYQWYRQGNLTWRVDTRNGTSCIDYATREEWRKPIVYTHGCGRT